MQYASICLQGSIKLEKDGKITFERGSEEFNKEWLK